MSIKIKTFRPSLTIRFTILSLILVLTTSLIISLFVLHRDREQSFQELVLHGRSMAAVVSQSSRFGIYTGDQGYLRQVLDNLSADPHIAYVMILDSKKEQIFARTFDMEVQVPEESSHQWLQLPDRQFYKEFTVEKTGQHYIDILTPVVRPIEFFPERNVDLVNQKAIGYVQLGLTRQGLDEHIQQFFISLPVLIFLLSCFGFFLTRFMTRKVTSSVKQLTSIADSISDGKFDHAIEVDTRDELEDLAMAFQVMVKNLKHYYKHTGKSVSRLTSSNLKLQNEMTNFQQTEEDLRENVERYKLAERGINDGLWNWNIKTKEVYYSPRWKSMIGFDGGEIQGNEDEWFNRIHPDDLPTFKTDLDDHLSSRTSHFENEHRLLHKDGHYRWMHCRGLALMDIFGKASRIAGSITDINDQKKAEEDLHHDAFHDTLTGLPNRALFMDRLQHAASITKRSQSFLFAVLFLDIDRFKIINDSLGHTVGDKLLIAISRRLEECLRPGDTVARHGGDEFTILLEEIQGIEDATQVADRIHEGLQSPLRLNDQEVFITASIGIALGSKMISQPEDLIRYADIAMYHAKLNGKARFEVFDTVMHDKAVSRMKLETDLRKAIDQHELQVYYQPIVSGDDCSVRGFEALLRWHHPEHGLIYPEVFIPTAEETGLIITIGRWVLYEACRQIHKLQEDNPSDPPYTISVNISSKQFSQDLVTEIRDILAETGLAGNCLILEITESMLIENADTSAFLLTKLQDLNVRLHIDDFGTGYSSLNYLHRFPISVLKIDRSFVNRMDADLENLEIVKSIITLAHNLKMEAIAEGVETEHQMNTLKSLNCDYLQGFLFSESLNIDDLKSLITTKESLWKSIQSV